MEEPCVRCRFDEGEEEAHAAIIKNGRPSTQRVCSVGSTRMFENEISQVPARRRIALPQTIGHLTEGPIEETVRD